MFIHFIAFEIKKGLRSPQIYVFSSILFLFCFVAVTYDDFTITLDDISNIGLNAPYAVMSVTGIIVSSLGMLFIAAIMSNIALRDINSNFYALLFATPVDRFGYFFGRMCGGLILCLIPFLGLYAAYLLGLNMPWIKAERLLPFDSQPFLEGFFYNILPNVILLGSLFYGLGLLFKNKGYVLVVAVLLYMGYIILAGSITDNSLGAVAIYLDPLGYNGYRLISKYWSVTDKNSMNLGFHALFLGSRVIWLAIALCVTVWMYKSFSFTLPSKTPSKEKKLMLPNRGKKHGKLFLGTPKWDFQTYLLQFYNSFILDLKGILTSIPFLVILVAGLFNLLSGTLDAKSYLGIYSHPTTFIMLTIIKGKYVQPLYVILLYYAGELVWGSRDVNFDNIYNAAPYANAPIVLSKFATLWAIIMLWLVLGVFVAVFSQALAGYTRFQIGVYVYDLMVTQFIYFALLAIVGITLHVLLQNRYLGYLVFLLVAAINLLLWNPLGVNNHLIRFLDIPSGFYSDFYGHRPFRNGYLWYTLYWSSITVIIGFLAVLLWKRQENRRRSSELRNRLIRDKNGLILIAILLVSIGLGSFVSKRQVVTDHDTVDLLKARYETTYGAFKYVPQPTITSSRYHVDIHPEDKELSITGELQLTNTTAMRMDSLHISAGGFALGRFLPLTKFHSIEVQGAYDILIDSVLGYRILRMEPPLNSGESTTLRFKSHYKGPGILLERSNMRINSNGSFFNNFNITPRIGYDVNLELGDNTVRKDLGLENKQYLFNKQDSLGIRTPEFDADGFWVDTEVILSTSPNQTAITSGTLIKTWEAGNRNYFQYSNRVPVANKLSFASAEYYEERGTHRGKALSVYYHPEHRYNVDTMMDAMKKTLDYCAANFGPYPLDHLRIVEFPRYATYASTFPGTIMYSEALGFLSDYDERLTVDFPYYVTAHEIAHQWWGMLFFPARTKGSGMLSESLAQYCALMVLKEELGSEAIKNYLQFEHDQYFLKRGDDIDHEQPLVENESKQYIDYHKGALAFYALQERIGEKQLNTVLRSFLEQYQFQDQPPFPIAWELLEAIKDSSGMKDLDYITDLFEHVVEHDIRLLNATSVMGPNGPEIHLEGQAHKRYLKNGRVYDKIPLTGKVTLALYRQDKLVSLSTGVFDENGRLDVALSLLETPTHVVIDPYFNYLDAERNDNRFPLGPYD